MMLSETKDAIKRNMFVNRGYRDDAKWDKGCY